MIISSLTKLANLVLKAGEVVEQISSSSNLEFCKSRDFSSYGEKMIEFRKTRDLQNSRFFFVWYGPLEDVEDVYIGNLVRVEY